jgi:hypothetical protein
VAAKAPVVRIERPPMAMHHADGETSAHLNGHAATLLGALQAVKKGDARPSAARLDGIDGKIRAMPSMTWWR